MATKRRLQSQTTKSAKKKDSYESLPLFDAEPEAAASKSAPKKLKKSKSKDESSPIKRSKSKGKRSEPSEKSSGKSVHQTAQSMALRQREISVSEFFAKNRHLLGFDSLSKALLTTIKEAVDNSLDACEEAGLLPDIIVEIHELAENRYKVVIEDSGPGIVKAQVPRIFGKLLYGSKFHSLKQARGQQGIGISAAGMYAQLTTGKPVTVISRTGQGRQAYIYDIQIDTKKNAPVITREDTIDWTRDHGTRIEMEILATYKKGQRSVDTYVHQVAMANPHAHITYRPPRDAEVVYQRIAESPPPEPLTIKPHPHGVELGVLMEMLKSTKSRNLRGFLSSEFSRMSPRISHEVINSAGLKSSTSPKRVSRDESEKLIQAFADTKIMKPATNCLSVIGEELLAQSMAREFDAAFYKAITRPPAVYRGNPFQIEVALAYGGRLPD
ncbi:MAG: DNA topoisomerase VI subunit B, partial [Candidatus Latescibacterota bacterium]